MEDLIAFIGLAKKKGAIFVREISILRCGLVTDR